MTARVVPAETDWPGILSMSSSLRTKECFSIIQLQRTSLIDMRPRAADDEVAVTAIVAR